ncbi:Phytosulfokine [Dillenia turbinata]|uniref:Phytosulfokine n=1 Tax=Dillenia turbinata TaxID=194707 RepID=A0AAN8ZLW5_9MAGN
MKMKQSLSSNQFLTLVFFGFLIFSSTLSARLLTSSEVANYLEATMVSQDQSHIQSMEEDTLNLIGLVEACDDKDEECAKRRIIAEAHLDYIYTQHHKP